MSMYPEAYDEEHLKELIDANSSCPNVSLDEVERIVDLARRRADTDNPMDDDGTDHLIATDWTGFARDEFGYDNGSLNQFAIGEFEHDSGGATLFTDTYVIQSGWIETGDGRRSQVEEYIDEDYDGSEPGEIWIPKSAQEYMCIVALTSDLVHGSPSAADAM